LHLGSRGREFLPQLPSVRQVVHKDDGAAGATAQRLEASYSRPYIAHASIGTSCALAHFADGRLSVWSHTQGSHKLRDQIARAMRLPDTSVDVVHTDGAGCY
jgi:CO/xanthine dehydrogenase Mo-binding subunit